MSPSSQEGSAAVDFVLVGTLLTVLFLAIIQLALVLHVRNTLIDAASSGARFGALADRSPADSSARTQQIISSSLNSDYAQNVSYAEQTEGSNRILTVTVRAPFPIIGLIGLPGVMEVNGRAVMYNSHR